MIVNRKTSTENKNKMRIKRSINWFRG